MTWFDMEWIGFTPRFSPAAGFTPSVSPQIPAAPKFHFGQRAPKLSRSLVMQRLSGRVVSPRWGRFWSFYVILWSVVGRLSFMPSLWLKFRPLWEFSPHEDPPVAGKVCSPWEKIPCVSSVLGFHKSCFLLGFVQRIMTDPWPFEVSLAPTRTFF